MPEVLGRLDDMIAAIEASETILQNEGRALSTTEMLALERAIEIGSEASRHIPERLKDEYPDTPWRQIAGIGNVLRHDHRRISQSIIVKVATEEFPALKDVLLRLRRSVEEDRTSRR